MLLPTECAASSFLRLVSESVNCSAFKVFLAPGPSFKPGLKIDFDFWSLFSYYYSFY